MHRLDERRDVLRGRVLRYAMAEVEDVARAGAEGLEDAQRLALDRLGRREERHRIHVSLQGDFRAHAPTRFPDIRLPVDAQRIGSPAPHRLEPRPAALREQYAGDGFSVPRAREAPEDAAR